RACGDEEEEGEQEGRREIEEVALLDPLRPLRGEHSDLEHEPGREGGRRSREDAQRAVEVTCARDEHDQRGERDNEEREVERCDVVHDPAERGPYVVAAASSRAAVAAEHLRRGASKRE